MKIKVFVMLLLCLQLLSLPAHAAEEEVLSTENDTPEPELSQPSPSTENDEASTPSEDSFIPSIQISEDLSVSFPVDI